MTKAVIYARYSSGAQKDVSIDQQVRACRDFADRQALEVVAVYDDRALTGTNDRRPSFQRMIADSAKEGWSYVIVYSLDRFARDRYDSAIYKRKLKDHGVRVLSAMEHLTDDPSSILLEAMLEGYAEYYSKELAQKTQRGMLDNARQCKINGPIPAGYMRGPDGKYAIYEPDAAVIRDLFRRVSDGEAVASVVRDILSRDLRRLRGQPWSRSCLYAALSNERYAGVYLYGDVRIDGGIPPIISREIFDSVQLLLESKPNPRQALHSPVRRKNDNGLFLLTGKLFCGDCGSPMIGTSGRGKYGSVYYYYACRGQKAHVCKKAPIRREQIEYEIAAALKSNFLNAEVIPQLADAFIAARGQSDAQLELQSLLDRQADVRRGLKNIMAAIEQGIFSATVQARLTQLEAESQQIDARIAILSRQLKDVPTRDDIIALLDFYRQGDLDDSRYRETLLDAFLRAAYVYSDHYDLVCTIGKDSKSITVPTAAALSSALSDGLKSSDSGPDGSPSRAIRTLNSKIVVFDVFFAFRCPAMRIKKHL